MSGIRVDMKGHACSCLLHLFFFSFSCLFILFFLFAIWSSTIGPTKFLFRILEILRIRISTSSIGGRKKQRDREIIMEIKRDLRVEKKEVEEDNMCTALLTAFVVLSMACLKHFSSVSYLIEQWRSLVFLLLNVVLLAVYFTSTRPISGETQFDFKTRRGGKLRMMRGKKNKKTKKTRIVDEPACSEQDFLVVEPKEVIKNCVLEETKWVFPEFKETVKDCLLHKNSVDLNGEEDEFEPGRLSNEELNERVEAFITTFRQHLLRDARRGTDRETDQKMRSKDSDISFFGREVTCSI